MNNVIIGGIGVTDLNNVPGSLTKQCTKCNCDLSISPSSLQIIAKHPGEGFDFMCMPCFSVIKDTLTDENGVKIAPEYVGVSEESLEELKGMMKARNFSPERTAAALQLIATLQTNPELMAKLVANMQAEEKRIAGIESGTPPVINLDDLV